MEAPYMHRETIRHLVKGYGWWPLALACPVTPSGAWTANDDASDYLYEAPAGAIPVKKRKLRKKKPRKKPAQAAKLWDVMVTYSMPLVATAGGLCIVYFAFPRTDSSQSSGGKRASAYLVNLDPATVKYKMTQETWEKQVTTSWTNPNLPKEKNGKNEAPHFKGYEAMACDLFKQLDTFEKWYQAGKWKQFFHPSVHYDWWVFPVPFKSRGEGTAYAAYKQDIAALQAYVYNGKETSYQGKSYADAQKRATYLVLWAAGWVTDPHHPKITGKYRSIPSKDRQGKMLHASLLFDKATYEIVNAFLLAIQEHHPKRFTHFAHYCLTLQDALIA